MFVGPDTSFLTSVENVVGSAYNDQLTAEFGIGTYTLDGGGGNDNLTVLRGTAIINGGSGDDTMTIGEFNPADEVDGGTGNNTLYLFPDLASSGAVVFGPNTIKNFVQTILLDPAVNNDIVTNDAERRCRSALSRSPSRPTVGTIHLLCVFEQFRRDQQQYQHQQVSVETIR